MSRKSRFLFDDVPDFDSQRVVAEIRNLGKDPANPFVIRFLIAGPGGLEIADILSLMKGHAPHAILGIPATNLEYKARSFAGHQVPEYDVTITYGGCE
jgi:hypothetical protein